MFSNKRKMIVISMFLLVANGLEQLLRKYNIIQDTEYTVRIIVNKLFSILQLRDIKDRTRLGRYSTMHKYFVSQSLRDDENLKYIRELTKVTFEHKNAYYNSTDFIAFINEVINEDKIYNTVEDISVIKYIEHFIANLKKLRDTYAGKKVYVNINTKVLEHLKNIKPINMTSTVDNPDKSDDNITSDNEFWEPSGRRIYKGERTKIKYFPFMASIHIFNSFYCAGSIIKSDLIITASSCLQLAYNNRLFRENPAFLSVRVGSSFYSGGGEVISILEVYFHPGYDPKTLRNNLCIIRLSRHLKFSRRIRRVKRIDFDRNAWSLPLTTPGVTILGWGAKGRSGIIFDPWKNFLSFAILDIYPRQDCQDVYSKEFVTSKHFCAGFLSKGGGACNRDVGGPGVVDGKLMGVVSFGSPTCGTPDAPTVFTKLGFYTDWIEDIMEKKPPVSLKKTTAKDDFDILKAMIPTKPPPPTTFKIAPITGKTMKPMSIFDIDKALRLLDEDLFKEFVSKMFDSNEIREYQNNLRNKKIEVTTTTEKQKQSASEEIINAVEFVTKMPDFDDNEITTVAMETESSESKETAESDIVKFMKSFDLKRIIQEEVNINPHVNIKTDKKWKNESVVTYLYLTDDENNRHMDIPAYEEGLSIQAEDEKFDDIARTKDKENVQYSILPENELYSLLSDVIETEVKTKIKKDPHYNIDLFLKFLSVYDRTFTYIKMRSSSLTNLLQV